MAVHLGRPRGGEQPRGPHSRSGQLDPRPGRLAGSARGRLQGLLGAHAVSPARTARPGLPHPSPKPAGGGLADIFVLDTRQFRADQCGEVGLPCNPELDAEREMLGEQQQRWLGAGPTPGTRADWGGAGPAGRVQPDGHRPRAGGALQPRPVGRLHLGAERRSSPRCGDHHPNDNIVLTGDIHASGVSDIKADYWDDSLGRDGCGVRGDLGVVRG